MVYVSVTPFIHRDPEALHLCFFSTSDFFTLLLHPLHLPPRIQLFPTGICISVLSSFKMSTCGNLSYETISLPIHCKRHLDSSSLPDLIFILSVTCLRLYINIFLHWCTHYQIFAVTLPCTPFCICLLDYKDSWKNPFMLRM